MDQSKMIHRHERLYFGLLVAASVLTIIVGIIFSIASLGIFLIVIGTFISIAMFTHWIQIGHIRTNGVKVTKNQFTDLYETYQRVGQKMGIRLLPDVYILQAGGILNAFATRFFQKNMVVLYSDIAVLARNGQTKEVEFILAHELAHIRRHHVQKQWLVLLGSWIPFLGTAYSRACEYTCDRMAASYIQDGVAAKQALTILAVGGKLATEVNEFEYLQEANRENGFIAKLSEMVSTHPTLPKRIAAISIHEGATNVPGFKSASYVKISIIGAIVLSSVLNVVLLVWLYTSDFLTNYMMDILAEESFQDLDMEEEPLQDLASEGTDYDAIKAELDSGADVNMQDEYGDTPLHNLFYNENVDYEIVKLLLDTGADVTIKNNFGETPRDMALGSEQKFEVVELLRSYE